jgi:hypothetical protein
MQHLIAFLMALAGLLLIGCGTTVCWLRWGRNRGKSVEDLRREQGKNPP